jgi:hypothetical protein
MLVGWNAPLQPAQQLFLGHTIDHQVGGLVVATENWTV